MKLSIGKYKKGTEQRKFKLETCADDFYSLDSTLSLIIVPMLKEFKEVCSGSPFVYWEDVPEYFKKNHFLDKNTDSDLDAEGGFSPDAWNWILDEMIIGFENPDKIKENFMSGESDIEFKPIDKENKLYEMVEGPNHTFVFDKKGFEEYTERMKNGRKLFAKYYESLWY